MRPRFVWQPELRHAPSERKAEPDVADSLASAAQRAAADQARPAKPAPEPSEPAKTGPEPEPCAAPELEQSEPDDGVARPSGPSDAPVAAAYQPGSKGIPRRIARGAVAVGVLLGIAGAFLFKPQKPDALVLDRGLGQRANELVSALDRRAEEPAPPPNETAEDHRVETIVDLDTPSPSVAPPRTTRARPRVSVEYRPYRSIPLRPGEKSVAFPPAPPDATVSVARP